MTKIGDDAIDFDNMIYHSSSGTSHEIKAMGDKICVAVNYDVSKNEVIYAELSEDIQRVYRDYIVEKEILR